MLACATPLAPAGASSAAGTDCPDIPVQVVSGSITDRALVCSGAADAVRFFQRHQVAMKRTIQIRLTNAAIVDHGTHIGLYDATTQAIDFLSLQQAVRLCAKQSPFGTPMDEDLYKSFAAHEVAHAIVDQNSRIDSGSRVAHEYIAYVAQLSTMRPHRRSEILHSIEVGAFEHSREISLLYYEMDPDTFAVKVYRHFRTLADRTAFLQALLAGGVTLGDAQTK
jgi:hypothetical protein